MTEKNMLDNVQKAIELAVKKHGNPMQLRKEHSANGYRIPFVVHVFEVMKKVFYWGAGSPNVLAAAACHDTLEDTDVTEAELMELGVEVFNIVKELTFTPSDGGKENFYKHAQEKKLYIASFKEKSVEALVVKLADRYCNVHDFLRVDPEYAAIYLKKAAALFDTFELRKSEISAKFGQEAVDKIENSLKDLNNLVLVD